MPRALAGLDSSLISTIAGVRNALDRRVERGVFGEEVNSSSMLAALRSVRTGHFTSVKLLHLISKEDSSSPADPLKGFRALSRAEAATAMRDAFAKLTQVISVASPNLASTAIPFIEKLKKRLCTAIDDDVGWSQISDYYASIMRKVAQPTRQYSFGEGGSLYAVFDSEWIDAHSTARDELERATQEKRAEGGGDSRPEGETPAARGRRHARGEQALQEEAAQVRARRCQEGDRHGACKHGDGRRRCAPGQGRQGSPRKIRARASEQADRRRDRARLLGLLACARLHIWQGLQVPPRIRLRVRP